MAPQNLSEFRQAFETALIAPYATHQWHSARARSHWVELEAWQDAIAGPLGSISHDGTCQYVYTRQDEFFTGVADPESLKARLLKWHASLLAGIVRFVPSTDEERADLDYMHSLSEQIARLIDWGIALEHARWRQASSDPDRL